MKPENWISIASAAVSASMAAIGLYFGPKFAVKRALEQFRSTKSWEQSTEAYAGLLQELGILKHTNRLWYEHCTNARIMNHEERERCQAEHQGARRAIERKSIANMLFISEASRRAIDTLVVAIEDRAGDLVNQLEREWSAIENCITTVSNEAPKRGEH